METSEIVEKNKGQDLEIALFDLEQRVERMESWSSNF